MVKKKADVNIDQSKRIGKTLRKYDIRKEFYKREFLNLNADRETQFRIYFLSVAICHQTRSLYHKDLHLWGWDYLEYGFLKMLKENHPLLNPEYVGICNEYDIIGYLQETFSADGNKENCTLDRLEERADMIIEICNIIREEYNGNISKMIDGSKGLLLDNGKGIYEVLAKFSAFSDPERKKSTFFLKLIYDAGLVRINDPENLIPIMDYHMQRVLLRMGCVDIIDPDLKAELTTQKQQKDDIEVRKACIDAVKIISKVSEHEIIKINDFFWSLGRSCCKETTLCKDYQCMKNPCTFFEMVNLESHETCIFEETCLGSKDEQFRNIWEPIVETHYY